MTDYVQMLTTAESREDAYAIAHDLVSGGHAASVQVAGPVVTIFRQHDAMVEAQQWHLTVRTPAVRLPALEAVIRASNPHSASEVIVTPIVGGDAEYLKWIDEQTSD